MKFLKDKIWAQLFIIYTRYLVGGAFVFASVVKIRGGRFTTVSGEFEPIDSAWHLFETLYRSGLYWKFIGLGQIIAGFFLMTQRYSKLGALMFLPIVSSVFVITLSYPFAYTPVVTGGMLLANLLLVTWDWDSLKVLLNKNPDIINYKRFENDVVWEITGLALFLFTAIYRLSVNGYNIFLWGSVCLMIGLAGLVIGMFRKKKYKNI